MLFRSRRAQCAALLLFPLVRLFPNIADTPSASSVEPNNTRAAAACQFDLSSTLAQPPVGGGQIKVTVQANLPNCDYTANSNVPWITVVNVDHATNVVTMVVESNPGLARNGAVTIAGVPFIVSQPSTTRATGARFVAMQPCRVMDTRLGSGKNGPFGIPHLVGQNTRNIPVPAGSCNIPTSARAYSINVTVVPPAPLGFVTLWPTGQPRPTVSTVNSFDGRVVANAAIVPAGVGGGISTFASNDTDIVLDINGYFIDDPRALTFFPTTPCRIADTRPESGLTGGLGGPILVSQTTRNIPVLTSRCGIAQNVEAYSLNITAVPSGPLGFLTVWQSERERPLASTLNSPNGQVVANAAIVAVPGGSGSISLFASDNTHVVVDINGYFAPPLPDDFLPDANFNLSYFAGTPCRLVDTRPDSGMTGPFGPPAIPAQGSRDFPIRTSACNVDPTARAYVLNATAVPPGPLSFLTMFSAGTPLPLASTLNSPNGQVVANMAIVQAGAGTGGISAFSSNPTHLVLDISGYFAR